MNIAFDHQIFSQQRYGGISRYLCELILHLLPLTSPGLRVIAPVHINEHLARDEVLRGVSRGVFLPMKFRGGAKIASALARLAAPYFWSGERCDIIHETYYSKSTFGSGRARVLTIHDMIHELFPNDFPNSTSVTTAKRIAANRADHIICVSETTKRDAIRILNISPQRCSVVPLGCSIPAGAISPSNAEDYASQYILYVGQRGGYKNFQTLLHAYASSTTLQRRTKLIAFGGGGFSSAERNSIKRHGIDRCVCHVAGGDALLQRHYRSALAFIYPSKYEGFGMPPLEAMSVGCPVVCSASGSLPEIVGDAAAYFQPEDSIALRNILERLMDDHVYADALRERGHQQVRKYTWENCARSTLAIYRQALGISE